MSKFAIKEGTKCFISSIGHNNFYYPSARSVNTLYDVEAEMVCWIGGGDKLIPIKVPSNCIDDKRYDDGSSVVWMEK